MVVKRKSLSENCFPPKPYIGANSDQAKDLPTGLETSREGGTVNCRSRMNPESHGITESRNHKK